MVQWCIIPACPECAEPGFLPFCSARCSALQPGRQLIDPDLPECADQQRTVLYSLHPQRATPAAANAVQPASAADSAVQPGPAAPAPAAPAASAASPTAAAPGPAPEPAPAPGSTTNWPAASAAQWPACQMSNTTAPRKQGLPLDAPQSFYGTEPHSNEKMDYQDFEPEPMIHDGDCDMDFGNLKEAPSLMLPSPQTPLYNAFLNKLIIESEEKL